MNTVQIGDKATLILGDCLEYMRTMEAGSVDAVVTDWPYAEKINTMNFVTSGAIKPKGAAAYRNDYRESAEWDKEPVSQEVIDWILATQKQAIFGGNFYPLPPTRCWLIWDKKDGGLLSNDFADCEMCWTNLDKPSRIIRHKWSGMIQQDMSNKELRYHPTQKPIAVMKRAISMISQERQTIFDPFMGSGTTGVACMQLGRRFIGCEIDPGYFAIAEKRIRQAAAQMLLPGV